MNLTGDSGGGVISYAGEVRRKLVHLSSLWMPLAMVLCGESRRLSMCIAFAVLFVLSVFVERLYVLGIPVIAPLYKMIFGGMLRREPSPGQWIVSGGPYVLGASSLALLFFPVSVAAPSLAVMLVGDTAAALIGRRFGRHKVNGKSWEGCAAFVVFGYGGAALFLGLAEAPELLYIASVPAVCAAALAELFAKQLRVNDNFSIPVVFGSAALLFGVVFG